MAIKDGDIFLCISCENIQVVRKKRPGSIFIEIILWLALLLPGLIYTLWRFSGEKIVCKFCLSLELIPEDSSRAQRIMNDRGSNNNPQIY